MQNNSTLCIVVRQLSRTSRLNMVGMLGFCTNRNTIQYNTNTITIIGNVLGSMWWVCQAFVPRTLQFCAKSRQQTPHQYFQYFETFGTKGRHNNKKLNLKFWQYF